MLPIAKLRKEPSVLRDLEVSVEKLTGKSVADLRQSSIEGYRRERESVLKQPMRIISKFPFIGRGNVLRDRIISRGQIDKYLDAVLR